EARHADDGVPRTRWSRRRALRGRSAWTACLPGAVRDEPSRAALPSRTTIRSEATPALARASRPRSRDLLRHLDAHSRTPLRRIAAARGLSHARARPCRRTVFQLRLRRGGRGAARAWELPSDPDV